MSFSLKKLIYSVLHQEDTEILDKISSDFDKDDFLYDDDGEELSEIDDIDLDEFEKCLEDDPGNVIRWFDDAESDEVSAEGILDQLALIRSEKLNKGVVLKSFLRRRNLRRKKEQLPVDFSFDGMDLKEIPIDPSIRKFETKNDALGWALNAGAAFLAATFNKIKKVDYRFHNENGNSSFVYDINEPADGKTVDIALFADFGTGLYQSKYIAKQLEEKKFPYTIHLGDVYYASKPNEFKNNFEEPLQGVLPNSELFTLLGNHEMYAGGKPFFKYMDFRKQNHGHKQEGSYFCLRNSQFQVIGIDTAYFEWGRYKEQKLQDWLSVRLTEGRNDGKSNILLSSDHPYRYGSRRHTKLLSDLSDFMQDKGLIDLWFWGNTHYCALFNSNIDGNLPFIGSCIGHGGYPYTTVKEGERSPADVLFLETRHRFHGWEIREDRGNNGYCVLRLKTNGRISLEYFDWMGNHRFTANLRKDSNNKLVI